jgi:glutamyl-tRNA reductase
VTSRLELVAVGLDHTTAGIELRERVAFAGAEIPAALEQLTAGPGALLEQAAILSTCNRVELYGVARARPTTDGLAAFLARWHGLEPQELVGALSCRRGEQVARHVAATAAGLHSLVLGEAQIQGQVRSALEHALAAGSAGPELRRLFESAIAAGRRVRSRTGIGRGVASIPHAGVELARRWHGTLRDSVVLLIGAGATAELAAKQLARHGVHELVVLGRDAARAERFARRHAAHLVMAHELGDALARADVVITAAGGQQLVVRRAQLEEALARRTVDVPRLLLIDLAVPRDVDPEVTRLPGVELRTIDDLRRIAERTLADRATHLPAARAIVDAEVARFTGWLDRRAAMAAAVRGFTPGWPGRLGPEPLPALPRPR